jgi:hypothetical protein
MAGSIYYLVTPHVWVIEKILFGDITKLTAVGGINKSDIPVMIVQCSSDNIITTDNTSIYAHRDRITNPNVIIYFRDADDTTGHEYVFCSTEQRDYMAKAEKSWQAFREANNNATRQQWAREFNFDKDLANQLDLALMNRIMEIFNNAK